jgi:Arc/MetJ-type ribon-helix-helix transcriptional regulator
MTVELHPDDRKVLEGMIASGRFRSAPDALHAALAALDELETEDWKGYAAERIEAGLEDVRLGRTVPAQEIYAMLQAAGNKTD